METPDAAQSMRKAESRTIGVESNTQLLYDRPYAYVKRGLDLLSAIILGIPASILVVAMYVHIKIEDPHSPVFFVQERPGYKGKIFKLYKLRSMTVESNGSTEHKSDMERMTKIGRFIRKWSLDELPQLYNVLRGDMSFIGPRPLLVQYLPLYTPEQMRRHDVRPGISGWAQVNGRNELSWEQKFERDVWYVDHMSFGLDLKILWMTIVNVLNHQGVSAGKGGETMTGFTGTKEA